MKVKLIKGKVVNGVACNPDDSVELPQKMATDWIARGIAAKDQTASKPKAKEPAKK